ncbi:MAG: F0F1 ATP synthase subunit B [Gammaproteobacteria bacterium]|nr:F0F1 ATP synthase subunit B [Gammaproteobacteria bacterium]
MNITATLFGQMITFVIFVWFIKAYLWEPLTSAMEERTSKIADGLASAELGEKRIDEANIEYSRIVDEAKVKATDVITMANQQSTTIIEDAKVISKKEAEKIISLSNQQIGQDLTIAKDALRKDISRIAIACAEKIIKAEISQEKHKSILDEALKELK